LQCYIYNQRGNQKHNDAIIINSSFKIVHKKIKEHATHDQQDDRTENSGRDIKDIKVGNTGHSPVCKSENEIGNSCNNTCEQTGEN